MGFRIKGLPAAPFQHLFGLPDDELAHHGAKRYVADQRPGFPDRIELRDPAVDYVHAHYAKRGCFACRIERS
jgi:Protein of unknown function (DUF1203)